MRGDGRLLSDEISRPDHRFFRVLGADVEIDTREVSTWSQPMVQSTQQGLCVFVAKRIKGLLHFLVQAKIECGNFDVVELAPTVQSLTGNYQGPGSAPALPGRGPGGARNARDVRHASIRGGRPVLPRAEPVSDPAGKTRISRSRRCLKTMPG